MPSGCGTLAPRPPKALALPTACAAMPLVASATPPTIARASRGPQRWRPNSARVLRLASLSRRMCSAARPSPATAGAPNPAAGRPAPPPSCCPAPPAAAAAAYETTASARASSNPSAPAATLAPASNPTTTARARRRSPRTRPSPRCRRHCRHHCRRWSPAAARRHATTLRWPTTAVGSSTPTCLAPSPSHRPRPSPAQAPVTPWNSRGFRLRRCRRPSTEPGASAARRPVRQRSCCSRCCASAGASRWPPHQAIASLGGAGATPHLDPTRFSSHAPTGNPP
mmetsp:Transcript_19200/g.55738  ORF Transcript_19200/g.55738 Transcript_19200/m.55738 type:complete len:282 (+) Transcript_19200:2315-3160(+)